MLTRWSEQEIQFLKENFLKLGVKECSKILNRPYGSTATKANRLKLIRDKEELKLMMSLWGKNTKPAYDYKSNFLRDIDKFGAYFLGIMWADGNISKTTSTVKMAIIEEDGKDIKHIFKNFNISYQDHTKYNKNSKTLIRFMINDKKIHQILKELDYLTKSGSSANKVIKFIPDNLHHYWWLGYTNGDGCFYFNKEKKYKCLSFSSTYHQNWDFVQTLSEKLNFKYEINRKIHKIGKNSEVRIRIAEDIIKFGNYIYQDYNEKDFGFLRKKNKFEEIKNNLLNYGKLGKNQ